MSERGQDRQPQQHRAVVEWGCFEGGRPSSAPHLGNSEHLAHRGGGCGAATSCTEAGQSGLLSPCRPQACGMVPDKRRQSSAHASAEVPERTGREQDHGAHELAHEGIPLPPCHCPSLLQLMGPTFDVSPRMSPCQSLVPSAKTLQRTKIVGPVVLPSSNIFTRRTAAPISSTIAPRAMPATVSRAGQRSNCAVGYCHAWGECPSFWPN